MRQERETFWEDGWAAGREEGRLEGRKEGKLDLLREQIQKKLSKGKTTVAIAEELEIEEAFVLKFIQEMKK